MSDARICLDRALDECTRAIAADPNAPATLRVGGVGHRDIDPDEEVHVYATLSDIFGRIRTAAARKDCSALCVLTSLAEGADRIIARAGVKSGFRLGAILPFDADAYELTFDRSTTPNAAVAQFRSLLCEAELPKGYGVLTLDGDADAPHRQRAFRECASVLSDWSDIVIAILRPDQPSSETAMAVRGALEKRTPVIAVDPKEPGGYRLILAEAVVETNLEDLVEALIGQDPRKIALKSGDHWHYEYWNEPIALSNAAGSDFENSGPFRAFTVAPLLCSWFVGLNRAIVHTLRATMLGFSAPSRSSPPMMAWDLDFDDATARPFVELFLRHHRADVIAGAYAELHRSGQILTVLLGVAIGVIGVVDSLRASPVLTIIELVLLVYAASIVIISRRQRWLQRWLDYRLVAEILRCAKFLLVSGHSAASMEMELARADALMSWTHSYCRRALRAFCLAMPGRAAAARGSARKKLIAYLNDQCLERQIHYHAQTASLRNRVNNLFRHVALTIGGVTVAMVAIKLVVELAAGAGGPHPSFLGPIDRIEMSLPALAGALFALRAYGEHMIVVRRSKALLTALDRQRRQILSAQSIYRLQQLLSLAISVQFRDVDAWFELFVDKPIEI